jgi:hypothetical protein
VALKGMPKRPSKIVPYDFYALVSLTRPFTEPLVEHLTNE